jgi:uncharacterized protein YcgI (DUF1989 family)
MSRDVRITGGHGGRIEVAAGQLLEIVNIEGGQVLDLYGFAAQDHRVHSSPSHTRVMNDSFRLEVGHSIWTVRRDPMFDVLHDDVGVHDLSLASCDRHRYAKLHEMPRHRSCRTNLAELVADFAIPYEWLPHPINIFQNTPIRMDGTYGDMRPSPAKAGDKMVLKARMDTIVVGSACPFDLLPLNGDRLTDILFAVRDG